MFVPAITLGHEKKTPLEVLSSLEH
jgi:hypothetical protein